MLPAFVIPIAAPSPAKQPERASTALPAAHQGQNDFSRMLSREMAQGSADANAAAAASSAANANRATATQQARPDANAARANANTNTSAKGDANAVQGDQQAAGDARDSASGTEKTSAADTKTSDAKEAGKNSGKDGDKDGKSALDTPPSAADQMLALAAQIGKLNQPQSAATATAAANAVDPAAVDGAAGPRGLPGDAAGLALNANGKPLAARSAAPGKDAPGATASVSGPAANAAAAAAGTAQSASTTGLSPGSFMAAMANAGGKAATEGAASGDALLAANGPLATPTPMALAGAAAAASGTIAAASGASPDKLAPTVGRNGWDQALGQRVVWMVSGGEQSASLSLNPPDLGPLQVVLNISQGHATASFTAAQPEVRQALEAAMPRLREMLGEAGINLGQANVSAGTPQQQQGGFAQQSASPRDTGPGRPDTDNRIGGVERIVAPARRSGRDGMVDTFA
jgi:flagellar hook-length control protein FliK